MSDTHRLDILKLAQFFHAYSHHAPQVQRIAHTAIIELQCCVLQTTCWARVEWMCVFGPKCLLELLDALLQRIWSVSVLIFVSF